MNLPLRSARPLLLALLFTIAAQAQSPERSILHHRAPEFTSTDLNHRKIQLAQYRGKVVLLNFWATWCVPCLTEMPVFSSWQHQYGPQGLQVIGISMDDSPSPVAKTVARLRLSYPIVMGDEHLGTDYGGVLGLPVTFLIARDGTVRFRYQGAEIKHIQRDLETLLANR